MPNKNPIVMAVEIAYDNYTKGHITAEQLAKFLRQAINATAKCNGYEEKFGLPFPKDEL